MVGIIEPTPEQLRHINSLGLNLCGSRAGFAMGDQFPYVTCPKCLNHTAPAKRYLDLKEIYFQGWCAGREHMAFEMADMIRDQAHEIRGIWRGPFFPESPSAAFVTP